MPTRFYYEPNNTPAVSPAFGAYADTTQAVRRNASLTKTATTETLAGTLSGVAGNNALIVQLVSPPLDGDQTISGTWIQIIRARELAAQDNINQRWTTLRVVSNDGNTVRGTLRTLGATGGTTEYGTAFSGILMANTGALTTVNALHGDRIVIEGGCGESAAGTTPNWEAVLGGDGTDHAVSNGDTTGTVAWVELSGNLVFQSPTNSGTLAGTVASPTADLNADAKGTATLAGTVSGVSADLNGSAKASATLSGTLTGPSADLNGAAKSSGPLAGTVASPTADLNGTVEGGANTGTLAGTVPKQTADLNGTAKSTGALAGSIAKQTAALSGLGESAATLAGSISKQTADLNGLGESAATLAGSISKQTADLNGSAIARGPLAGSVPKVTADLNSVAKINAMMAGTLSGVTADIVTLGRGEAVLAGAISKVEADLNEVVVNPDTASLIPFFYA